MSAYEGRHQLWLEPGADPREGTVEATLADDGLSWRWTLDETTHEGELRFDGSRFRDTFHQSEACAVDLETSFGAKFAGSYAYGPEDQRWGWRITVAERPTGELVVQMTNITPWGESAPAVQWVMQPK